MSKTWCIIILIFYGQFAYAESIEAIDPWIRAAPPSAKNLAGYVILKNTGNDSVTLDSANSEMFSRVELHVTSFENGMMRMKEIKSLKIAPQKQVDFEPGGKHFMLIKPKRAIKEGLVIPVLLKLNNNKELTINFKVRK